MNPKRVDANQPVYEADSSDAKVCWNDQRDYEDGILGRIGR